MAGRPQSNHIISRATMCPLKPSIDRIPSQKHNDSRRNRNPNQPNQRRNRNDRIQRHTADVKARPARPHQRKGAESVKKENHAVSKHAPTGVGLVSSELFAEKIQRWKFETRGSEVWVCEGHHEKYEPCATNSREILAKELVEIIESLRS